MQVLPLEDRVLVRPKKKQEKTDGGLFIPENVEGVQKVEFGTVVEHGPGRRTEDGSLVESPVTTGDQVMYPPHAGLPIKVDGEELLLLDGHAVLAIVKE